jgi:hypothetical protein
MKCSHCLEEKKEYFISKNTSVIQCFDCLNLPSDEKLLKAIEARRLVGIRRGFEIRTM